MAKIHLSNQDLLAQKLTFSCFLKNKKNVYHNLDILEVAIAMKSFPGQVD